MRVETIRALPGPNIYTDKPVLKVRIELESLAERETKEFPGFNDRLLALLPGLREHHCAKGRPGGFVERLEEGTYFGHTVEHVAIELAHRIGSKANHGKTRFAGAPGRYDMIIEYDNEPSARFLVGVAVELVQAVLDGRDFPLKEKLAEACRICTNTSLGPSTKAIVDAAAARGIPHVRLDEYGLVQLGQGVRRRLIRAAASDGTSSIAVDIVGDKHLTKELLEQAAIPVPRGVIVRTRVEALAALRELTPPLVVKPLDGHQGLGVTLRVDTPEGLAAAFDRAAEHSRRVVVEEFYSGRDYRVLVIGGKVVAAAERTPAHVIGDGRRTIRELVDAENEDPARGDGHEKPLTKIVIEPHFLERCGRSPADVPGAGERVFLSETANLSTGGKARDATDLVHPSIARVCERAAAIVGLDICGVDMIAPDISRPLPAGGAGIVELNSYPGLRMHAHPSEGQPRDVGGAIVDMLYPPGTPSRIPVVAITGTNGKTTVTRLIAHILSAAGRNVGMTTTDGIWIGGELVAEGDLTGFHSARTVLADPSVEAAVLETARGGIVRRSLGYDWSDVGVMTNIQPDHLGQDGIETIDDLLFVKSLVAERTRSGGTLVLNADDERLAKLPENPRVAKLPREIIYFSLSESNPVIEGHRAAGGTCFLLKDGWLVEAGPAGERHVVREEELPITLLGAAKFQTANALAAFAACRAMGVGWEEAGAALASFESGKHNHGRMNMYRVPKGYVIVDYGHNPGAFQALSGLANAWGRRRITGVFTAPGDRDNSVVEELGRVAAHCFDKLIIREDEDLRGRQPGEIAEILCRSATRECPGKDCRAIHDEREALRVALDEMDEGDVVLFFYEKHGSPSLSLLREVAAVPVESMEPAAELQHA